MENEPSIAKIEKNCFICVGVQSAVIILLSVLVLVMGSFFYRSYDMQAMSRQLQQTQQLILQLRLDPTIGKAFSEIGYRVNVAQPTQPSPIPSEAKKDSTK